MVFMNLSLLCMYGTCKFKPFIKMNSFNVAMYVLLNDEFLSHICNLIYCKAVLVTNSTNILDRYYVDKS